MSCDGLIIYLAHSYIEYYTDIFCELFCEHIFFYKPAAHPPDNLPKMKEPAKYANDKTLPSTSVNEQRPGFFNFK